MQIDFSELNEPNVNLSSLTSRDPASNVTDSTDAAFPNEPARKFVADAGITSVFVSLSLFNRGSSPEWSIDRRHW
jgi:hypothetical protein